MERYACNYMHCIDKSRSIFRDEFGYIDTMDNKIIDILKEEGIKSYEIKNKYAILDSGYKFCFIECNRLDANKLRKNVFPKLQKRIMKKKGNKYIDYCDDFFIKLMNV